MPTYSTVVIPKSLSDESLTLLADKLRIFKLQALLSDPNAFSQNYATESRLPLSAWEVRVGNPDFRIVVCIIDNRDEQKLSSYGGGNEGPSSQKAEEHGMAVQRLVAAEWVGTFTLVGPVMRESWLCPQSKQPSPAADGEETRWHLTSLFVLPEHRGRGLAAKLTLAAVSAGSSASRALSREPENRGAEGNVVAPTRFRLIVHPKNMSVVGLYEKLGFVKGGKYTQREAMVAMGDAAGIPSDGYSEKWDTRSGIGMEYLT